MSLTGDVSRMSTLCRATVLILLVSLGETRPTKTILGSRINIFDLLEKLFLSSSSSYKENLVSQLNSNDLFANPVESKWERRVQGSREKFRVILCNTIEDLTRAVNGGYKVSGLDWSSLRGINDQSLPAKYLGPGYSYALVKYSRVRYASKLKMSSSLSSTAQKAVSKVDVLNPDSIHSFFKNVGTHYLSSFTMGDAIYQIYVFRKDRYRRVKWKLNKTGELSGYQLQKIFSPFHLEYVGPIKTLSGHKSVLDWLNKIFYTPYLIQRYVEVQENEEYLRQLRSKTDSSNTFLSFEFKSVENIIEDKEKKKFIHEMLHNKLMLYEANL